MIANPTTLILGAGASHPFGYPTGLELRKQIITGSGAGAYQTALKKSAQQNYQNEPRMLRYETLLRRFENSHVVSIDAFLAEPENNNLANEGRAAIAAALLQYENQNSDPDWYADLFNAIRFRDDGRRKHKLKIITFNYDLSLEYRLYYAFVNTYGLSPEEARQMFFENVEIIHVYGDLGELCELSDSPAARHYGGDENRTARGIIDAGKRIHIIGRHEERRSEFTRAFEAIKEAVFVAILGYGFDPMNNENLRLQEAVADKHPFATGYGLGCGARARLASLAHQSGMISGGKAETVRQFLAETDFLQWINEPGATGKDVSRRIVKVFSNAILPYVR